MATVVCHSTNTRCLFTVATHFKYSVSEVDRMAVRENEIWNPDHEQELLRLVHDDTYRIEKVGDFVTKWPAIAHYLGRTVKSVKRKYDKLFKKQQQQQQMLQQQQEQQEPQQEPQQQNVVQFDEQGSFPEGMKQYYPADMVRMGGTSQPYDGDMPQDDMAAFMQQGGYAQPYIAPMYSAEMQGAMFQPQYDSMAYMPHMKPPPPKNDKSFWKDSELAELLRLCREEEYRQHVTGSKDLNWQVIADIFGRGKRSVQRKYENLKSATFAADGTLILPRNLGKKWSKAEVNELMKIADPDNSSYRFKIFGSHKIDWRVFGEYFGRSHEAVAYKFSYEKNSDERLNGPSGPKKHVKAKHETSYKDMAIKALQFLGGQGTSSQMCDFISQDELFAPQLDQSIVSGKKTLQRWKHGVRSALNAFDIFNKTEGTFKGEAVWVLNLPENYLEEAEKKSKRRKPQSHQKRKRKSTVENESGEEFAREVLTQMAQNKTVQKKSKKKKNQQAEQALHDDAVQQAMHYALENDGTQLPLNIQQILDSSATAEQLSMLPPEQLAMLQQQIDQGNFAMNMMAYMPGDGNQHSMVDPSHHMFQGRHGFSGYDPQYDHQQRHTMNTHDGHQVPFLNGMHMGQHSMHPGGMLQMHPGPDYPMYNPYGAYMSYQYPDTSQHHYQVEQYSQGGMGGVYMPMHGQQPHSLDQQQYDDHDGRHRA